MEVGAYVVLSWFASQRYMEDFSARLRMTNFPTSGKGGGEVTVLHSILYRKFRELIKCVPCFGLALVLSACQTSGSQSTGLVALPSTESGASEATAGKIAPVVFLAPTPGTKAHWRNVTTSFAYSVTYRSSESPFLRSYYTESGEERAGYMFCTGCAASNNRIDIEDYAQLFPLVVGKKVRLMKFRRGDSTKSWTHEITVVGADRWQPSFAAEMLDVLLVKEIIVNNQTSDSWETTYWYAPSINLTVRSDGNANDDGKVHVHELTGYTLP